MQVGITGGIGAGKSIVCKIFNTLGIPVYHADSRAKQLMEESTSLQKQIKIAFGKNSFHQTGKLNRRYLAELVFSDPVKVQELNKLVHPEVAKDYTKWVDNHENKFPYILKEAALLIESGSYKQLDYLVTVLAPVELRITRVLARDTHRERRQVELIISRQLSDEQRINESDMALYNDEKQPLIPQVLDLHERLLGQ